MKRTANIGALAAMLLAGSLAQAADPLAAISTAARTDKAFSGFSAERGAALWERKGKDWSCSTCHTTDPRQAGRHTVTGKVIKPMAPASNPARFTDSAKVEKWFKRNCRDVFNRECTAQEKGDVITWLRSIKP
ncbi:MAG: DUF1924 domain-containing protein [Gammaproteobacteria bacterium]|jgi:hypothetical protein|nr:DUF1924 domain-containing protein [Gammaproteobacteria bacterium]